MRKLPIVIMLLILASSCAKHREQQQEEQAPAAAAEEGKTDTAKTASDGPVPDIEFEKTDVDVGEVNAGDEVAHVFAFKNKGDAKLEIKRVRGG